MPTEYWSRPIDPQLREWYSVSGNWLTRSENAIALYNDDAPETAHVLWARNLTTGGLTGGLWGDGQVPSSAETGDAYEGKFANSVVMNGVLYYNKMPHWYGSNGIKRNYAVDLHSGKELWFKNNTYLSFGQILLLQQLQLRRCLRLHMGCKSGSTWKAYDPFTGRMDILND